MSLPPLRPPYAATLVRVAPWTFAPSMASSPLLGAAPRSATCRQITMSRRVRFVWMLTPPLEGRAASLGPAAGPRSRDICASRLPLATGTTCRVATASTARASARPPPTTRRTLMVARMLLATTTPPSPAQSVFPPRLVSSRRWRPTLLGRLSSPPPVPLLPPRPSLHRRPPLPLLPRPVTASRSSGAPSRIMRAGEGPAPTTLPRHPPRCTTFDSSTVVHSAMPPRSRP